MAFQTSAPAILVPIVPRASATAALEEAPLWRAPWLHLPPTSEVWQGVVATPELWNTADGGRLSPAFHTVVRLFKPLAQRVLDTLEEEEGSHHTQHQLTGEMKVLVRKDTTGTRQRLQSAGPIG